jgi:hypothetical protein
MQWTENKPLKNNVSLVFFVTIGTLLGMFGHLMITQWVENIDATFSMFIALFIAAYSSSALNHHFIKNHD